MKIQRIEHRPSVNRARLRFEDDAAPALEIAVDLLLREGLAPGDSLTSEHRAALESADEEYRAREAALSLLAHRARARAELRRRLARKDFSDTAIEQVLAWLDDRGYINDHAFAQAFVKDRLRLRPKGRRALRQELRKKGVADSTADAAIDSVMGAEDVSESELASQAARSWVRKNGSAVRAAASDREARLKLRRRLYGHLARRGFGGEAVRIAIRAALDD